MIDYDIKRGSNVDRDAHCNIKMGNDIARDIHYDVTMSKDIVMCTSQCIITLLQTYFCYVCITTPLLIVTS